MRNFQPLGSLWIRTSNDNSGGHPDSGQGCLRADPNARDVVLTPPRPCMMRTRERQTIRGQGKILLKVGADASADLKWTPLHVGGRDHTTNPGVIAALLSGFCRPEGTRLLEITEITVIEAAQGTTQLRSVIEVLLKTSGQT